MFVELVRKFWSSPETENGHQEAIGAGGELAIGLIDFTVTNCQLKDDTKQHDNW